MLVIAAMLVQAGVQVEVSAAPSPGGFVDAEFKRRQDSTVDLERALRKAGVTVGASSALRLVVVSSQRELTGESRTDTRQRPEALGGGQRSDTVGATAFVIRVQLRFGDYVKDFLGIDSRDVPTWTRAAENAAKQIHEWVEANAERVCRESPLSCR